ncbi:MAG: hypothetical protein DELT_01710 [Desulfovibrio sp.]
MRIRMNFEQEFRKRLEAFKESRKLNELAERSGVEQSRLSRTLSQNQQLGLDKVSRLLEAMGARVVFPDHGAEAARDVCFVNAKVAPVGEYQAPPQEEDYMAVPLVEEVGAGPGLIPQGELLSWFLVYKHQDAVRYRRNLVAVQIAKNSTSMTPLLHPGDVVLVDLDDKDTKKPGRIMLVMDPHDGSGMIKRVAVDQQNSDYRITFYSDNAAENPPSVYSWREDFHKDWNKAIAGHVVWAWADISGK